MWRSVTSASADRREASSGVQLPSGARQLQLPAATAGVFMRRLRAQFQQILRGDYSDLGHAAGGGANQRPDGTSCHRPQQRLNGFSSISLAAFHQPCVVSLSWVPV